MTIKKKTNEGVTQQKHCEGQRGETYQYILIYEKQKQSKRSEIIKQIGKTKTMKKKENNKANRKNEN